MKNEKEIDKTMIAVIILIIIAIITCLILVKKIQHHEFSSDEIKMQEYENNKKTF